MAHTNQTPNYELSQFLGTDKPAWLVDYNGDMEKIDLGMKAAKDVADAAKTEADQGAIDIESVTVTANSADAKATGAVSDLADAYDSTSTYNARDYVIYNNILYKCIANITVPESFDGNHWERTTVEEIIAELKSELSAVSNRVGSSMNRVLLVSTSDITNEVSVSVNLSNYKFFNVYTIRNSAPRYRFATSLISSSLLDASSANDMLYFGISSGTQWLESGHIYHDNGILHVLAGNNGWTFVVEGYTN